MNAPPVVRTMRIIHGALVAGLVSIAAVFMVVTSAGARQPLVTGQAVVLALAGASLAMLVVAMTALRRRIPERRFNESPEAYWTAPASRTGAILLWAMTESAALLGLVGYFLTGALVSAVSAALAIGALILVRPSALEGRS